MVNWEVLQGVDMNSICAAGPWLWGQGCGSAELQEGEYRMRVIGIRPLLCWLRGVGSVGGTQGAGVCIRGCQHVVGKENLGGCRQEIPCRAVAECCAVTVYLVEGQLLAAVGCIGLLLEH